jgi:DNA polymerase-1
MNKIDTMIRSEGLRARMLLQIHDELIFEVEESILELHVPLKTSMHIGNHWDELK